MLRILRPLRLISRNKGLKLSITSLINSAPSIANLMVIVAFCIFLLGILGTTLFSGKFYKCTDSHLDVTSQRELIVTKWDCLNHGGDWVNRDMNFDTTLMSMLTLACIQTTEGWITVMWHSVDAVGSDLQPIINYN